MSVCEDRHPGADDWFRQHSQTIDSMLSCNTSVAKRVCAGHRRLVLPMFTTCYVLLFSICCETLLHYFCVLFFRATGIEFLVAHYIRSIHLGLQF